MAPEAKTTVDGEDLLNKFGDEFEDWERPASMKGVVFHTDAPNDSVIDGDNVVGVFPNSTIKEDVFDMEIVSVESGRHDGDDIHILTGGKGSEQWVGDDYISRLASMLGVTVDELFDVAHVTTQHSERVHEFPIRIEHESFDEQSIILAPRAQPR